MTAKIKTKVNIDLDSVFGIDSDQPLVSMPKVKTRPKTETKSKAKLNTATAEDTVAAVGNITATAEMVNMLSGLRNIKLDDDLPSYEASVQMVQSTHCVKKARCVDSTQVPLLPKPETTLLPVVRVTAATLPTVAQRELVSGSSVSPVFYPVAALPGNMRAAIRQLGHSLFRSLTKTPTDKIHVVANVADQGPNTNREVQAVAQWIKNNGDDYGLGAINFDHCIPGYTAEVCIYTAADIVWMLVKDFAGQYIYTWPLQDSLHVKNYTKASYKIGCYK